MQGAVQVQNTYRLTVVVDKLENRIMSYLLKQAQTGERLDPRTLKDLFGVAKQELRLSAGLVGEVTGQIR